MHIFALVKIPFLFTPAIKKMPHFPKSECNNYYKQKSCQSGANKYCLIITCGWHLFYGGT